MNSSDSDILRENLSKTQVNYGALSSVETNNGPPPASNTIHSKKTDGTARPNQEHTSPSPIPSLGQQEPPKPAVRQRVLKRTPPLPPDTNGSDVKKASQGAASSSNGGPAPPLDSEKYPDDEDLRNRNGKQEQSDELLKQKGGAILPMPTESISLLDSEEEERPYPKKVLFIIANEFCERFSYYGLRGVLVLYFKSVLGFSDSSATVSYHMFATLCYLTPILGAILADSVWGKFKTILYLSFVYLAGEIILVSSSIFWNLDGLTVALTFIGLVLIGIGTGGIKPCVSALGGDQFLPTEVDRRECFFSFFYGTINLGALIAMFLMPIFRSNYKCFDRSDCYPFAFGVPSALMLIAIVFFLAAAKHYVLVPLPKENVIMAFCRCTWLAFKRRLAGQKVAQSNLIGQINHSISISDSTLNENLSDVSSTGGVDTRIEKLKPANDGQQQKQATKTTLPTMKFIDEEQQSIKTARVSPTTKASVVVINRKNQPLNPHHHRLVEAPREHSSDQNNWLYLAADQYDTKTIEGFRSVWRFILLFLPTPVYWCLFDQQSSLWTLQATRMNGELPGGFFLEPDQMPVANPLLLLLSIPFVRLVVYPAFNKCNLLTNPVSKMTAGGVLAAMTFVASALIEVQIQGQQPLELPNQGYANLLLVNGLPDCSIVNPTISYVPIPNQLLPLSSLSSGSGGNSSSIIPLVQQQQQQSQNVVPTNIGRLEPLKATTLNLLSSDEQNNLNTYQIKFKLSNDLPRLVGSATMRGNEGTSNSTSSLSTVQPTSELDLSSSTSFVGCPFNLTKENEFVVGPLSDQSIKLLYVEQGNGKVTYKLFNDSMKLPSAGKARVRLLFEFFGSIVQAEKRQFSLVRLSGTNEENSRPHPELQFNLTQRSGQVLMSNYIDVTVPTKGDLFALQTNDNLMANGSMQQAFKLEPGTRNLLIVQQLDANQVELKLELLQGNEYRVSILYQLIPYLMISISEVMFSITGMELAYSMAPETMKSVVLGFWSLTVAMGNILTVAVESIHPFANVVHDFLFYATLMLLDICIFAFIGYYHNHSGYSTSTASRSSKSRHSKRSSDGSGRLKQSSQH